MRRERNRDEWQCLACAPHPLHAEGCPECDCSTPIARQPNAKALGFYGLRPGVVALVNHIEGMTLTREERGAIALAANRTRKHCHTCNRVLEGHNAKVYRKKWTRKSDGATLTREYIACRMCHDETAARSRQKQLEKQREAMAQKRAAEREAKAKAAEAMHSCGHPLGAHDEDGMCWFEEEGQPACDCTTGPRRKA